ncbi:MAG: flavodoxin family protein [Ruminococcaceae bacterium]|nr:flavodoxin family protein [Oscillospiraceae bacterium]
MKVLLVNSSAHTDGATNEALEIIARKLEANGIEAPIFQMGASTPSDCTGCLACRSLEGKCIHDDDCVNKFIDLAKSSDGFVFATPVYYAHPSARLLALLDRAFYANTAAFAHKPAAAVANARRAGTSASLDVINKYFTIAQMPVVSSSYWNGTHGVGKEQLLRDLEGVQTLENLANNMTWLLRCIKAGKDAGILTPKNEKKQRTNFIR